MITVAKAAATIVPIMTAWNGIPGMADETIPGLTKII